MRKLRFALVGCGNIGQRHAPLVAASGELTAVCDRDRESREKMASLYGCVSYDSLDYLLGNEKGIDIAVICTPNYLHAEQAISCLRAGLHVICEKPMAINTADGKRMLKAAADATRKLFIVKQIRFNPPVTYVKHLLDDGSLGRIHAFQVNCFWNRTASYYNSAWKGKKAFDGGILYTQFSHFIDILIWFLGEAVSVQAAGGTFLLQDVIEVEDTGFALLQMKSGAVGTLNYTITSFQKNMEASITLFGEKGTVKIGGPSLNRLEYFCVKGLDQPPPELFTDTSTTHVQQQGSMRNHEVVYQNVVNAMNNLPYSLVEGEEGFKSVELIERITSQICPRPS